MKLTRPVPMWQQVADHVRDQILDGTYPSGQPLPSEEALAAEFGVSRPTIREGIKTLVAEGLVEVSRPRGTIVRDPFGPPVSTEIHTVSNIREDDGWADADDPDFIRVNATADQSALMDVPAGEPLLVRAVMQHKAGLRRLSRLYVPFSVAQHTPWADEPHLPPPRQAYEYLEGKHVVLTWTEHVRARMPVGDEAAALSAPPGVPLLIVLRLCHTPREGKNRGDTLGLEETRSRADQVATAFTLA